MIRFFVSAKGHKEEKKEKKNLRTNENIVSVKQDKKDAAKRAEEYLLKVEEESR